VTSRTTCTSICTLTLYTLLVEHVISSIWINRITTRSRWKFRMCTTTNDLTCIVFPHYTFLWPEDGPQWPKHFVSLIKQTQRQLCFDYLPRPNELYLIYYLSPLACSLFIAFKSKILNGPCQRSLVRNHINTPHRPGYTCTICQGWNQETWYDLYEASPQTQRLCLAVN